MGNNPSSDSLHFNFRQTSLDIYAASVKQYIRSRTESVNTQEDAKEYFLTTPLMVIMVTENGDRFVYTSRFVFIETERISGDNNGNDYDNRKTVVQVSLRDQMEDADNVTEFSVGFAFDMQAREWTQQIEANLSVANEDPRNRMNARIEEVVLQWMQKV